MRTIVVSSKRLGTHTIYLDDDDYLRVKDKKIWLSSNGKKGDQRLLYAKLHVGNRVTQSLHRYLLGVTDPKIIVDHINRNTLDNTRSNLRVGNKQLNSLNRRKVCKKTTSKYIGVHFCSNKNKYRARLRVNGVQYGCGLHSTELEAAKAYNNKVKELGLEWKLLNDLGVGDDV